MKMMKSFEEFCKEEVNEFLDIETEDFSEIQEDIEDDNIILSYDEYFILLNYFMDSGDDQSITYLVNIYNSLLKWYHRIFNIKIKSISIELGIIKAETISKLFSEKIDNKPKMKFHKNYVMPTSTTNCYIQHKTELINYGEHVIDALNSNVEYIDYITNSSYGKPDSYGKPGSYGKVSSLSKDTLTSTDCHHRTASYVRS